MGLLYSALSPFSCCALSFPFPFLSHIDYDSRSPPALLASRGRE